MLTLDNLITISYIFFSSKVLIKNAIKYIIKITFPSLVVIQEFIFAKCELYFGHIGII